MVKLVVFILKSPKCLDILVTKMNTFYSKRLKNTCEHVSCEQPISAFLNEASDTSGGRKH